MHIPNVFLYIIKCSHNVHKIGDVNVRVATHHEKSRPLKNKAWDQATHFEIFQST